MTLSGIKKTVFGFLVILGFGLHNLVFANPADISTTFNTGVPVGFNFYTTNAVLQNDGKTIIVGDFSSYKGVTVNGGIIRLNSDGSRDTSFNIPNGLTVLSRGIALQPNGKILIAGTSAGIARLNTDGSIDTSFNAGVGFGGLGSVMSIAVQSDGKIIVGGSFTTYQGIAANKIVRINTDGSIDTSFNAGTGFNSYVKEVLAQPNGKILALGEFSSYQGNATPSKIISLNSDGSVDTTLNFGAAFNNRVTAAAVQPDGKILVMGRFGTYKGSIANNIIRINVDGTIDTSFLCGGGGAQPDTSAYNIRYTHVTIQGDGKILVMGTFSTNSGVRYVSEFKRLNSDGSIDTSFVCPNIWDSNGFSPLQLLANGSGKIVAVGDFKTYNEISVNGIIGFNADGSRDTSFDVGNGFGDTIRTTSVLPDGKTIIGGQFTSYNGKSSKGLVKLNIDGSIDTGFDIGTGFDRSGLATIASTLAQPNGKILVGGSFFNYRGTYVNNIVRLNSDGTIDTSFNAGDGVNGNVYAIGLQSDGKIILGGDFGSYNQEIAAQIVRINPDGSRDNSFDMGTGWEGGFFLNGGEMIRSIVVQPDDKILVGGKFSAYKTVPANNIIRLNPDGSRDTSFNIGDGLQGGSYDGQVETIALQADGKILVGGYFETYKGVAAGKIIRLNSDGSRDTSFNMGDGIDGYVKSIMLANGKIVVGGEFGSYKGISANNIIRLNNNGSRDSTFALGNGFDAAVYSISKQINDNIVVGGAFQSFKGIPVGHLTTLYGDATTVLLPNSTDSSTVNSEFTSKGYVETNGVLVGSTPISLEITNGTIPTTLNLSNEDISLVIDANTQFQDSSSINYNGIFSIPINKGITSVNDEPTITAFNVGSISEPLSINGGAVTFSIPTTSLSAGEHVTIYYSQDNGVSWYPETLATAVDKDSQTIVSFTTNHLGFFAITLDTTDHISPIITLNGNSSVSITQGSVYNDNGATALDNIDGDISANIVTSGSVNTAVTGTYIISYNVMDAAGNAAPEIIRTITVISLPTDIPYSSNGGGDMLSKDVCPNGDNSPSYYDGMCVAKDTNTTLATATMADAYKRAFENGITTKPSIEEAAMDIAISRAELAKMVSQYATEIKNKTPDTSASCIFTDIADVTPDLIPYIEESCQLGIMGRNSDGSIATSFNPYGLVTRGEFATVLSRVLWGNKYDGATEYYAGHIAALYNAGIIENTDPLLIEARGYVMLMMMRASTITD